MMVVCVWTRSIAMRVPTRFCRFLQLAIMATIVTIVAIAPDDAEEMEMEVGRPRCFDPLHFCKSPRGRVMA